MVLFCSQDLYTYLEPHLWDSKNRHPFIMTEVRTMDPDIIAFQVTVATNIITVQVTIETNIITVQVTLATNIIVLLYQEASCQVV